MPASSIGGINGYKHGFNEKDHEDLHNAIVDRQLAHVLQ